MNTYKLAGRTSKLIKNIIENGGAVYGNFTITTNYLRNKSNITDLQTATKIVNNLYDYDSDFDDEPAQAYKATISRSAIKDYYTDLICHHDLKIIRLPDDLEGMPKDVFITISEYQIEDVIHSTNKLLTTIKFTDNTEMYGEVNTDVKDSIENIDKIVSHFYQFGGLRPIENINNDGYIAFKYGNDIKESQFKL